MSIRELSDNYENARREKERAEAVLKDANAALEAASAALADAMIDEEMTSFKTDDASYSLTVKDYYRTAAGEQEALMEALRTNGLGDIIKTSVNANTLSATMRDMAEENGGALPEEYDGLVSVYSKTTISRRRA